MSETPSAIDLTGMNAPDAIHAVKRFFDTAQEHANSPEVNIDDNERTPDGFIELGWEHIQAQRTLHLDFQHSIRDLPRTELERRATGIFNEINTSRQVPVDIANVNEQFLRRIIEPKWLELSDEEAMTLPEELKDQCDYLREVDAKLAILSQDEALRTEASAEWQERSQDIRAAVHWQKCEQKAAEASGQIADLYARRAAHGIRLVRTDELRIDKLRQRVAEFEQQKIVGADPSRFDKIGAQLDRLRFRDNRRQFEKGLLLTEQMQTQIDKVLPSLIAGSPVLFVGETGGAKTALAEFIGREYIGREPELVSFSDELNNYQLMGKDGLRLGETDFMPGPVVRAMEDGRPLILDEINAAPSGLLKRLNKIMQLRPGDHFTVQEDSGRQVTIQPGFCIMATANEKSKRYKGVDILSAELKNRFGANQYRIAYPDADTVTGQLPKDNLALANAVLTDRMGEIVVDMPEGQLEAFVKAAHLSQKLFSGNYDQTSRLYAPQDRLVDGGGDQPGLDDTVIAPRTMCDILTKYRENGGQLQLVTILNDWLNGVESKNDRQVMAVILGAQIFTDEHGVRRTLLGNEAKSDA